MQAATGQAVLGGAPLWHPSCLSGFVGVSGAYDLEGLAAHLHRRGLYKNLLDTIMSIDGQVRARRFSGCGTVHTEWVGQEVVVLLYGAPV